MTSAPELPPYTRWAFPRLQALSYCSRLGRLPISPRQSDTHVPHMPPVVCL